MISSAAMRTALFFGLVACGVSLGSFGCGGSKTPADSPNGGNNPHPPPTPEEAEAATHPCGDADKTQVHDLNAKGQTAALVPCAAGGKHDYSGLVKVETVDNGVHITIDARDDEVTILGPDVKDRDAVIVYPKSGNKKVAIEVPLTHTKTGYHGDKIVFWDDLDKLHDEGTKIDIAIYDHDKKGGSTEQLHVSVAISTGKSCEKAQDENPQQVSFDKKPGKRDLTRDELGAPVKSSNVAASCGLSDSAHAHICALVKGGRALGVSVDVDPKNNKVAACMDRKVRGLSYPSSDQPDTLKFDY
jgi:hypothetical protein